MIHQNKIELVPAVLPKSFDELERGLYRLKGVAPLVQVDVVDARVFERLESLPFWEDFDFEFDLFVEPAPFIDRAIELGASRIVVHERFATAREALDKLQPMRAGDFATLVGLGLRDLDTPDVIDAYQGLFDYVQIMGIKVEGEQGHPAAAESVELVRRLRAAHPDLFMQVDGAVAPRIKEFVDAGVNRLVVGSAIVDADDPKSAFKELYNKANGSH